MPNTVLPFDRCSNVAITLHRSPKRYPTEAPALNRTGHPRPACVGVGFSEPLWTAGPTNPSTNSLSQTGIVQSASAYPKLVRFERFHAPPTSTRGIRKVHQPVAPNDSRGETIEPFKSIVPCSTLPTPCANTPKRASQRSAGSVIATGTAHGAPGGGAEMSAACAPPDRVSASRAEKALARPFEPPSQLFTKPPAPDQPRELIKPGLESQQEFRCFGHEPAGPWPNKHDQPQTLKACQRPIAQTAAMMIMIAINCSSTRNRISRWEVFGDPPRIMVHSPSSSTIATAPTAIGTRL